MNYQSDNGNMCIVSGEFAKQVLKEALKKPSRKAIKQNEECSKLIEKLRN